MLGDAGEVPRVQILHHDAAVGLAIAPEVRRHPEAPDAPKVDQLSGVEAIQPVQAGPLLPVVGELVGSSAAELLAASAEMPLDDAEQEMRSWIEARPDSAARELAEAARSGVLPMMALHALTFARPEAESEVRAMLEIAELRPKAQLWLVGNGYDDDALLSPETLQSLMVETLAAQVDADGAVAAVAHFQGLGPDDEQIHIIEGLLHAEHPRTSEILHVIGRYHPTKTVAKAARKTAFKRQAFSSS